MYFAFVIRVVFVFPAIAFIHNKWSKVYKNFKKETHNLAVIVYCLLMMTIIISFLLAIFLKYYAGP